MLFCKPIKHRLTQTNIPVATLYRWLQESITSDKNNLLFLIPFIKKNQLLFHFKVEFIFDLFNKQLLEQGGCFCSQHLLLTSVGLWNKKYNILEKQRESKDLKEKHLIIVFCEHQSAIFKGVIIRGQHIKVKLSHCMKAFLNNQKYEKQKCFEVTLKNYTHFIVQPSCIAPSICLFQGISCCHRVQLAITIYFESYRCYSCSQFNSIPKFLSS